MTDHTIQATVEPASTKDILVLADEYASAVAEFAKGISKGDGSMSPLAVDAGDKRAVLVRAIEAMQAAQAAVEPGDEWTVIAPDGTRFTGPTPLKAAFPASKYRLEIDPVAAAKFAEVIEQIREEGEREHDECMAKFGTLNCPHCGGSGHIGDVQSAVEPVAQTLPIYGFIDKAIENFSICLFVRSDGSMTNAAICLVRPERIVSDASGEHPGESFVEITMTRDEARKVLDDLDRDWADHEYYTRVLPS